MTTGVERAAERLKVLKEWQEKTYRTDDNPNLGKFPRNLRRRIERTRAKLHAIEQAKTALRNRRLKRRPL